EGLHPEVVPEVLGPAVEADAGRPRRVEDARDAAVAAREHALDLGLPRLVPLHARAADSAELLLQVRELALERLDAVERRPLERRPRLRYEGADRDVDALPSVPPSLSEDALNERDELVEVRRRLRRQPDHRVDLDEVPPACERDVG